MIQKKVSEYGSEFDWSSNDKYININSKIIDDDTTQYFRSGRDALSAIAKEYKGYYKKVLMPALCCESMVLPFERNGYEIIYYKLNNDISINTEDLLSKIESNTIFLYINYFGNKAIDDIQLKYIKNSFDDLIAIEDRTHDILVKREVDENRFVPDYTVFSIRKWIAIPDGGILQSNIKRKIFYKERNDYFSMIRERGLKNKSKYLVNGKIEIKNTFRNEFLKANSYLEEDSTIVGMSSKSYELLSKIDFYSISKQRIKNAIYLSSKLNSIEGIRSLCSNSNQCNIYYPILVKERDRIQQMLAQKDIYCPVIWPLPQGSIGICKVSDYIANHILALPCDQRYTEDDMSYIFDSLKSLMEEI